MSEDLPPPAPRRHRFGKPISPTLRGYGPTHQKLRREILKDKPACALGCGRPATCADHVKPLSLGGETVRSNIQALCEPCHRSKSSREANYIRWHVRPGLARNGRGNSNGAQ